MKKLVCLFILLFLGLCSFSQPPKLYKALTMSMDTLCVSTRTWGNEMPSTDISGAENPIVVSVDVASGIVKVSNKGHVQLRIINISDITEARDSLGIKYQFVYMSCLYSNNDIIVVDVFKYQDGKTEFLFTVSDYRVRYICEDVIVGDNILKL